MPERKREGQNVLAKARPAAANPSFVELRDGVLVSPSPLQLLHLKKGARLRAEGLTWAQVATRLRYGSQSGVHNALPGAWPTIWAQLQEEAWMDHMQAVEAEAISDQRALREGYKVEGKDTPEMRKIAQSCNHSLLVHASKLRAKRLEITHGLKPGTKARPWADHSDEDLLRMLKGGETDEPEPM